jgi:heme A synthase
MNRRKEGVEMRSFKKWLKWLAAASIAVLISGLTSAAAMAYPAGPDNPVPDRLLPVGAGVREVTQTNAASSDPSTIGYWIAIGVLAALLLFVTTVVIQQIRHRRLSPAV